MTTIKPTYQQYKLLIPVIILTVFAILTILTSFRGTVEMDGESYDFELTVKHYGAFLATAMSWISFFKFRRLFKYVLGLTLLLGLINLINFTALQTISFIAYDKHQLGLQPTIFWISILTYIINFKRANEILYDIFGPTPEQANKNAQTRQQEQIDKFKDRYSKFSDDQLNAILTENKFVPEALEAVRQLLTERQKTQDGQKRLHTITKHSSWLKAMR
jgi:hypothetical protein